MWITDQQFVHSKASVRCEAWIPLSPKLHLNGYIFCSNCDCYSLYRVSPSSPSSPSSIAWTTNEANEFNYPINLNVKSFNRFTRTQHHTHTDAPHLLFSIILLLPMLVCCWHSESTHLSVRLYNHNNLNHFQQINTIGHGVHGADVEFGSGVVPLSLRFFFLVLTWKIIKILRRRKYVKSICINVI